VAIIPLGEEASAMALPLAHTLRLNGLSIEHGYTGNLKRRLARANKKNARLAVMIGEDELANGTATLRDLDSGEQSAIAFDELARKITDLMAEDPSP
jgi:histidyl-tRNA synthetase